MGPTQKYSNLKLENELVNVTIWSPLPESIEGEKRWKIV